LVITDEPSGMRASTAWRGVEIADDLDAEPVLFERDNGGGERRLIRRRGEPVGVGSRARHGWTSLHVRLWNPGPAEPALYLTMKLVARQVSACHLIPVIVKAGYEASCG
jgi:hypothetical protein